MKKRIWELDAFRGICIFGMMVVHFAYDLTDLFGIIQWQYPAWFAFMQRWGGVLFLLISGILPGIHSKQGRKEVQMVRLAD